MSLIAELVRQRQEQLCEFKARVVYIVKLEQAGLQKYLITKQNKTKIIENKIKTDSTNKSLYLQPLIFWFL